MDGFRHFFAGGNLVRSVSVFLANAATSTLKIPTSWNDGVAVAVFPSYCLNL